MEIECHAGNLKRELEKGENVFGRVDEHVLIKEKMTMQSDSVM